MPRSHGFRGLAESFVDRCTLRPGNLAAADGDAQSHHPRRRRPQATMEEIDPQGLAGGKGIHVHLHAQILRESTRGASQLRACWVCASSPALFLRNAARRSGSAEAGGASELVTQRELYGSWAVDGSVTRTKPTVQGPGVRPREYMPIEQVDEFRLKGDVLGFGNRGAFDDRKILIHIALAPHVPDHAGHAPEYITARGNEPGRIGIDERGAIEIRGNTRRRGKCSVVFLGTTGIVGLGGVTHIER